MGPKLKKLQLMLQNPISLTARIFLILSILFVLISFQFPLWTMSFESNQYPDPLRLTIYANHLDGQKTAQRDDLREINALNHYIGMRPLLESDFAEFVWIPFVVGFIALITLRAAVFGNLRDLIDLSVVLLYFGAFSFWSFYNRLYQYGHNLNPEAAIKVAPFTPPLFGRVQIANFWVESYPAVGSYALALFTALIFGALIHTHLRIRRNETNSQLKDSQA